MAARVLLGVLCVVAQAPAPGPLDPRSLPYPLPVTAEAFEALAPGRGEELVAGFRQSVDWIADQQDAEGAWLGPDCRPDVRATALALLALIADGSSTREGRYERKVVQGIRWLRDHQQGGRFSAVRSEGEPAFRRREPYDLQSAMPEDHALATLAVCEAYRFSKSPLIRATAQAAVRELEELQGEATGWKAGREGIVDLECTAWAVRALHVAREAGIPVAEEPLRRGLFALTPILPPAEPPLATTGAERTMSAAVASYVRVRAASRTGARDERAELELAALDFDGLLPTGRLERGIDGPFCIFGTTACATARGRQHALWGAAVASVPDALRQDDGSFDPVDVGDPPGGRLEATALVVLWSAAGLLSR